jgi:hypothetical protein
MGATERCTARARMLMDESVSASFRLVSELDCSHLHPNRDSETVFGVALLRSDMVFVSVKGGSWSMDA